MFIRRHSYVPPACLTAQIASKNSAFPPRRTPGREIPAAVIAACHYANVFYLEEWAGLFDQIVT